MARKLLLEIERSVSGRCACDATQAESGRRFALSHTSQPLKMPINGSRWQLRFLPSARTSFDGRCREMFRCVLQLPALLEASFSCMNSSRQQGVDDHIPRRRYWTYNTFAIFGIALW